MDSLDQKLKGLSIARRSVPKDPTYLLDVALQPNRGSLLAVSCSDLALRLHSKETLCIVGEYRGHTKPVCGLTFTHTSADLLYSGSNDGTVRGWDTRLPGTQAVQVFKSDACHSYCSFDLSVSDALLCAGTEQVNAEDSFLVFWDVRRPGAELLGVYSESHSDDITQVCFHPVDRERVATSSTDGLVNVFDLQLGSEDDALLATCNSDSTAASVCWSGPRYTQLLCLSHDEGLHLWDIGQLETDEPLTVYSTRDARGVSVLGEKKGGVDYLVGGTWLDESQKLLVVGGSNEGDVYLMECGSKGLGLLSSLQGGHSSTVRCFEWDSEAEGGGALFTGGEDAQLLLWKQGGEESTKGKRESMKSESNLRFKSRPHKQHGYQKDKKMKS